MPFNTTRENKILAKISEFTVILCLFGLVLYVPVNSNGHVTVRTVSSPNHTFLLDKLV